MTSKHIPALDGLRFLAAFFVLIAHYGEWLGTDVLKSLSGLGMALFFCLSGFVIHYSYQDGIARPGGVRHFAVARFTRLYPLFLLLFAAGFALSALTAHGACGHDRVSYLYAVPFYLTFTQSWGYRLICGQNLLSQYHAGLDVTWSLSTEAFFYLLYALGLPRLLSKISPARQLAAALYANLLTVLFLIACFCYRDRIDAFALAFIGPEAVSDNYGESLLRWLVYFNPFVNFAAFFSGMIAASLYRARRLTLREAPWVTPVTLLLLAVHFVIYEPLARRYGFFGRTGSVLYVPLMAFTIYLIARCHAHPVARMLSATAIVRLGEASYSIYLLHAFVGRPVKNLYDLHPGVPTYLLAMAFVISLSLLSYRYFERPARRWLRRRLER